MMNEMNPFARRFAEVLFGRFPEWRAFAAIDPPAAPIPGTLSLEVPSPREDAKPLIIDTDRDEVTIFFDSWHGHFGTWNADGEGESFAEAVHFLTDLVREEVAILVRTRDGAWAGSQLLYAGDEIPRLCRGEQARVVSWAGGLDQVHEADAGQPTGSPAAYRSERVVPRHSVGAGRAPRAGRAPGADQPDRVASPGDGAARRALRPLPPFVAHRQRG